MKCHDCPKKLTGKDKKVWAVIDGEPAVLCPDCAAKRLGNSCPAPPATDLGPESTGA